MRNGRLLCGLTTFGLLITAVVSPDAAYAKRIETDVTKPIERPKEEVPKTVWVTQQETDSGISYTVCFTENAFKFVAGSLSLVAAKPDWKVHVMNGRAKVTTSLSLKDFKGLDCIERYDVKKLDAAQVKEGSEPVKLASQLVTEYGGKPEYSPEKLKSMGFAPKKVNVWTASNVTVPDGALTVLSKLYGLETLKGLPLRVQLVTNKGEEIDCLSTNWCLHREMSARLFDVPKNYKAAKNIKELIANKSIVSVREGAHVFQRFKHKPKTALPLRSPSASGSTAPPASQAVKTPAGNSTSAVTKIPQQK